MIILGDVAVPSEEYAAIFQREMEKLKALWEGHTLIYNLEGLVVDGVKTNHPTPVLFNHESVIPVLKQFNGVLSCIANNHTLDMPEQWGFNNAVHEKYNLPYAGAGKSYHDARKPVVVEENGVKIAVFNHCWHVMLHHQKNPDQGVFVNSRKEHLMPAEIKSYKSENPNHKVMVYMHWNYDLEKLPFPAHRKIAKEMVDAGADLVIGTHAHCIQGGEKYNDGYIVYSLGNFFVPWYTFIDGHISFPTFSRDEMIFEWDVVQNNARVHFLKYNPDNELHELELVASENFENGKMLEGYSPFKGMSHEEYITYFKKYRRKKGGVPIYKDFHNLAQNRINDLVLISRMKFARKVAKMKLRSWNN